MIYYEDNEIKIRDLESADIPVIIAEEIAQGWNATADKYEMRLRHREESCILESDCTAVTAAPRECM